MKISGTKPDLSFGGCRLLSGCGATQHGDGVSVKADCLTGDLGL